MSVERIENIPDSLKQKFDYKTLNTKQFMLKLD